MSYLVETDHKLLQYSGRIDFDAPKEPVFVYAGSWVKIRFRSGYIRVLLENHHSYYLNYMGYILDGVQGKFLLNDDKNTNTYNIKENLSEGEHELLLFKRMDACHHVIFRGFEIEDSGEVLPVSKMSNRRIEVFGDSVSCGEVSEAIEYTGKGDPENHNGLYSNSWYSYSWIAARKLNAELHITSQGGAALLDQTGWFHGPDYLGLYSIYDKIEYNPDICPVKLWDFQKWIPQVVVFAFGQNDNHPDDIMAKDYHSEASVNWRNSYLSFLEKMMLLYPKAHFILTTTILNHDVIWDKAISEVCDTIDNSRVHRFFYGKNGCGTPGHIRIAEAEEMADELVGFIETLGDIWNE